MFRPFGRHFCDCLKYLKSAAPDRGRCGAEWTATSLSGRLAGSRPVREFPAGGENRRKFFRIRPSSGNFRPPFAQRFHRIAR
jgi:hypothetical protein